MNSATFLNDFQELLQRDEAFGMSTPLADMEEWDSLAMMATIAYFDKNFSIELTFTVFETTHTVADIAALVPGMEP